MRLNGLEVRTPYDARFLSSLLLKIDQLYQVDINIKSPPRARIDIATIYLSMRGQVPAPQVLAKQPPQDSYGQNGAREQEMVIRRQQPLRLLAKLEMHVIAQETLEALDYHFEHCPSLRRSECPNIDSGLKIDAVAKHVVATVRICKNSTVDILGVFGQSS
ncbi:hypothetical protein BGX29_009477 [Mortierella sp. GBA35]|nr:hypothetical protein BGX29_009477 [Mortierella sp. GBA35]